MRTLLILCGIFLSINVSGQNDRRNVMQSDISGVYKNAVKTAYYNELNRNYSLSDGYHGMFDFAYTFGVGDYEFGRIELNTTHGYQINPYFFLGGGLGVHFMTDYSTPGSHIALDVRDRYVDVPIFVDARVTILEKNITPFVEGKIGYFVTHNGGIYAHAALGCRFATWSRQAVNISFGYTCESLRFETFDRFISNSNTNYTRCRRKVLTNSLTIKIGYEF